MKKIKLVSTFIKNINILFPPGNIPTQLYDSNKKLYSCVVTSPTKVIATITRDGLNCCVYCFSYSVIDNPTFIKRINILKKCLGIEVIIKREHVVSQRRIQEEAFNERKIVVGIIW